MARFAAAVAETANTKFVGALVLAGIVMIRALLLPQECRAASHNSRRQKSLLTGLASQQKKKKVVKHQDQSCALFTSTVFDGNRDLFPSIYRNEIKPDSIISINNQS